MQKNSDLKMAELQKLLNDAASACMNANEDNLAFVHGYYTGISQGITAMGYRIRFEREAGRFFVEKDFLKTDRESVYARYTARIIENHFYLMFKEDPEHEQAMIDGLSEVLDIFGWKPVYDFGPDGFSVVKKRDVVS